MYVINESCIACGACGDSCPAEAIAMNDDLGRYSIDENKCMDCGACSDTCPMGCIAAE